VSLPARRRPRRALQELATCIEEALDLVNEFSSDAAGLPASPASPGSLLEQCMQLCAQLEEKKQEPVRTVHQLACTGGTLICKCLAAMPNVQLLSEADPLSPLGSNPEQPRFAPSDMAALLVQSSRGARRELVLEVFLNGLALAYDDCARAGQRLVVRDHAHSHFCVGPSVGERPTLRAIIAGRFPVLSVVTVRHPLDCFLSLRAQGWLHFQPANFDEYCARYIAFLHAYEGIPLVRYEDFVASPAAVMRNICDTLQVPFSEQFADLFDVFRLTGDSGRSGATIGERPRRKFGARIAQEVERSAHYRTLLAMLGYPDEALAPTADIDIAEEEP
jgi:hypothetical protein